MAEKSVNMRIKDTTEEIGEVLNRSKLPITIALLIIKSVAEELTKSEREILNYETKKYQEELYKEDLEKEEAPKVTQTEGTQEKSE